MAVASRGHIVERLGHTARDTSTDQAMLGLDPLRKAEIGGDFPEPLHVDNTKVVREIPEDLLREEELVSYLRHELYNADAERGGFIAKLARMQEVYRAPMGHAKTFPFIGAANLTVPLVKEMVDTQVAALSQTVLVPGPTWILKHSAEEWRTFKPLLENFMDLAGKRELRFSDKVETWIREGVKLGTSILEVSHEVREKSFYIYDSKGEKARRVTREVKSGPALYNVPLEDFYVPFSEDSIQESPWCAKRFELNRVQLKNRAESGLFRPEVVEELLQPMYYLGGDGHVVDDVTEKHEELEDTQPVYRDSFEIFECWLSWNLDDGDDLESEIQVYYHRESDTILSARFHPYRHGLRPFIKFVYLPVEYRFYGEGLCERLEPMQEEVSTIHNQRLDNATISNMRMWSVRRGSRALRPGDKIHSNKIIERDQADDVLPMAAGDIYPSTFNVEQVVRQYAERAAGLSDANTRGGFPVTRTTFGAQAALLQEQAKRLDNAIRNIREGVGEIGSMVLSLYFQYGAGSKPEAWLGKRGRILHGIFSLPAEAVAEGIGLEAAAPTSQLNRETHFQRALQLFNLLTQMYEKLLLMFQGLQPPPEVMAAVMGSLVKSAKQYMTDALELSETTNPEEILGGLTFLEQILPRAEDFGGQQQFQENEMQEQMLSRLESLKDSMDRTMEIRDRTARPGVEPFLPRATRPAAGEPTGNGRGPRF